MVATPTRRCQGWLIIRDHRRQSPVGAAVEEQHIMASDLAMVVAEVLGTEERARLAEKRALEAEARTRAAEQTIFNQRCEIVALAGQLEHAKCCAHSAFNLTVDITESGSHLSGPERCADGGLHRTNLSTRIRNLMVEVIHLGGESDDGDRETFTSTSSSESS